jgi:hypothetical protein
MSTKSAMNFRTTYILMGGAAVLIGALAIYVFFFGDENPNQTDRLFNSLNAKAEDINGLEIDKNGEKMVFVRQVDGRWRLVQPIEARADSQLVHFVIQRLLAAKREEKGADVMPNLAVHGLDNPKVKITLKRGDRVATLSLGNVTVGGDRAVVYALSDADPKKPFAIRQNQLSILLKKKPPENADIAGMTLDLDDFRSKKLLGEGVDLANSTTAVTGIKLTQKVAKGVSVVYVNRNNPDNIWRFAIPPSYGEVELDRSAKANPESIYNLPSLINTALSVEVFDAKDFLPEKKDLTEVGLDPTSPGVVRVDVELSGDVKETLWFNPEKQVDRDKFYVRYEGDASIAKVNASKLRMLLRFLDDPSALRSRTLVKLRPDRVDCIEVTNEGKTLEFFKGEGGRWKIWEGGKETPALFDPPIKGLIEALSQPFAVRGFPPADATDAALGLDKPNIEIKVWEDGLASGGAGTAKPKPKEAATVRILFGKKDIGDVVNVRRYQGLSKVDVKMADTVLAAASRPRLEYVDVGLKSFGPDKVLKITFPRGKETYEIERADKDGPHRWKILSPESKKGKYADPGKILAILSAYQNLQPAKVVADKPSAEQLAALGLEPSKPRFKLTMKVHDEAADRTYDFGNDVAGKVNVYTKTSMTDYVFESSKQLVELCTQGEIVDPVPYRLEAVNVKSMTLIGWSEASANGMPQVLELERTAGLWTPKGKLAIDSSRVEEFLNAISAPRAEAIVVENTGPKPEHGLDLNKGALQIEIELLDGKKVTLTLGALANKASQLLYAETNQAKGTVFTLKGDKLMAVKEKPTALRRE